MVVDPVELGLAVALRYRGALLITILGLLLFGGLRLYGVLRDPERVVIGGPARPVPGSEPDPLLAGETLWLSPPPARAGTGSTAAWVALRAVTEEVRQVTGVRSVRAVTSVPQPYRRGDGRWDVARWGHETDPEPEAELVEALRSSTADRDRLLDDGSGRAWLALELEPEHVARPGLRTALLRKLELRGRGAPPPVGASGGSSEGSSGAGQADLLLAGRPALLEASAQARRDGLRLAAPVGAGAVLLLAVLVGVRLRDAVTAAVAGSGAALTWLLGWLGQGREITSGELIGPLLALTLAAGEVLALTAAARRIAGDGLLRGRSRERALGRALAVPLGAALRGALLALVALAPLALGDTARLGRAALLGLVLGTVWGAACSLLALDLERPAPHSLGGGLVGALAGTATSRSLVQWGGAVLLVLAGLLGGSLVAAIRLRPGWEPRRGLPDGHPAEAGHRQALAQLGPYQVLDLRLERADGGGLLEPESLGAVLTLEQAAAARPGLGRPRSWATRLAELAAGLRGRAAASADDPAQDLPVSRAALEQLLVLWPEQGAPLAWREGHEARALRLRLFLEDPLDPGEEHLAALEGEAAGLSPPLSLSGPDAGAGSWSARALRLSWATLSAVLAGWLLAGIAASLPARSLGDGVLTLLLAAVPGLACAGLFAALGWPLEPTLAAALALAVGLGAAAAGRVLARFRAAYALSGDRELAAAAARADGTRSRLAPILPLALALLALLLSGSRPLIGLGLAGSLSLLLGSLGEIVLGPGLLTWGPSVARESFVGEAL